MVGLGLRTTRIRVRVDGVRWMDRRRENFDLRMSVREVVAVDLLVGHVERGVVAFIVIHGIARRRCDIDRRA